MAAVRAGGDRPDSARTNSRPQPGSGPPREGRGRPNDLIDRLKADPAFSAVDFHTTLDARQFIGRAAEQVEAFLRDVIEPIRTKYRADLAGGNEAVHV